MSAHQFKPGDRVRCVDDRDLRLIERPKPTVGTVYTVEETLPGQHDQLLRLTEVPSDIGWSAFRFVPADPQPEPDGAEGGPRFVVLPASIGDGVWFGSIEAAEKCAAAKAGHNFGKTFDVYRLMATARAEPPKAVVTRVVEERHRVQWLAGEIDFRKAYAAECRTASTKAEDR